MIKSLMLKLGMLSMAIGVVFWVRSAPQAPVQGVPTATGKPVIAFQAKQMEERENMTAGSSSQGAQKPTNKSLAQTEPLKTTVPSRLDLNRASADQLESLPGIGTVLAQRVIAFRESVGRFQKIEDLRGVKGIGAKKFEHLKSFVMVSATNS